MLGEYDFSDEKLRDTVGILPQNKRRKKAPIWEDGIHRKTRPQKGTHEILCRVWYRCKSLSKIREGGD